MALKKKLLYYNDKMETAKQLKKFIWLCCPYWQLTPLHRPTKKS